MEARYEIRERIGQGGMGSVFRAYDTRMNREVAIKRLQQDGDASVQQAASEQIVKEAGALALLQHPHIVTVYDVGTDDDGPYVVMELISGKTLDELIERAPLTWPDFRELALQTQEGLIAAHELNLVHRDLKPSNLMLTWLPSGKFQVKIVDFGLAKLVQAATLDHLDSADAVFGSIFFMSPEQFERATLDARADMYSIGCVYYHALAGSYPFNGATGMQVMTAHLDHQVTPLQDVRPDIPRWACDWVMWHINRNAADRPENAREALKVFLMNDNSPTSPMSTGPTPPAPEQPKRPRLIIPGATPQAAAPAPPPPPPPPPAPAPVPAPVASSSAVPEPPRTQTAPQPLAPPEGSKPSVHASPAPEPTPTPTPAPPPPAAVLKPAPAAPSSRLVPGGIPATRPAPGGAPAARPAPGGAPAARPIPGRAPGATPTSTPNAGAAAPAETEPTFTYKKPALSNGVKVAIAAVLGLLVVILTMGIVGKIGTNKRLAAYNRLVALAAAEDAKDIPLGQKSVPVTRDDLEILLNAAADPGSNEARVTILHALWWAKATDSTDVDARIVEFATTQMMADDIRVNLIRDVLKNRKNQAVVYKLLEFCRTTSDTTAAMAAIQACRFMATEPDFPKFVEIVQMSSNGAIRQAAEETAMEILKKSPTREALGAKLVGPLASATDDDVKFALLRLLGAAGGAQAADLVKKSLASSNKKEQLAAAVALGIWPDDSMFKPLMTFLDSLSDEQLRPRVFDAGLRFLTLPDRSRSADVNEDFWKTFARSAKTRDEQEKVIRGLANNQTDEWAISIIEYFVAEAKDDKVIDLAEKALDRMRERARVKGSDKKEEEPSKDADKKTEEPTKDADKKEEEPTKDADKKAEEPAKDADKKTEEPAKDADKKAEEPAKDADTDK